jgi:hypothetical protein
MKKIDLQPTEIYLYLSLLTAMFVLFLIYIKSKIVKKKPVQIIKNPFDEKKPEADILEIFDYLGTKIIHENGSYTVNSKGKVSFYKTWAEVPLRYQNMVVELDKRSNESQKKGDYFLEIINGVYKLTLPNGSIKKYKRLSDIPTNIRKAIGK